MSRSTFTLMTLLAMTVVYFEARWTVIEFGWRAQVDLMPVFAAYAALHGSVGIMLGLAILGGSWLDVLSANPLGTSLMSLFFTSLFLHGMHEVLLKGQLAAQFFVCLAAGALNPVLTYILLWGSGAEPLAGWGTLWQIMVNALVCGIIGPIFFLILNLMDRWVSYEPVAQPWNRSVVEVKRSRHYHH